MILHPLVHSPDGHKAKGEPRPSWEPETPSGFLVWVTVAHETSIFCCFPSLVVESWIRREAARTTACTPMECWHCKQCLNMLHHSVSPEKVLVFKNLFHRVLTECEEFWF